MRLVAHTSAYGNGTYFAGQSATAYDYCLKPDTTTAAAGYGAAGGALWAGGIGGMVMPPMPPLPRGAGAGAAAAYAQIQQQMQQMYGRGVAGYQAPAPRQYKMILARVALGKQTLGVAGMRRPPDGFDSVNSGNAHVHGRAQGTEHWCHVVFNNDQCYPEYLITFTP